MAARKIKITENIIREHISRNIEKWLFTGHIADYHINAEGTELLARLGKYSDGRLISRASSFLDMSGGDDIIDGLAADLQGCAAVILRWLCSDTNHLLTLRFTQFPKGVSGITCSISDQSITEANEYVALLCKNEQYPFYLLNAYPVKVFLS